MFEDKNVGLEKSVTAHIVISGVDAENYSANTTALGIATIKQAVLDVGISAENKVYDGTVEAATQVDIISGPVSGDDVTLNSMNGKFADANAGVDKVVTADVNITGTDLTNYVITSSESTFATILQSTLMVDADNTAKFKWQHDPELTYQLTSGSLIGADALTGSLTRESGWYYGEYDILQGNLSAGPNYNIEFTKGIFYINFWWLYAHEIHVYLDCVEELPPSKSGHQYIAHLSYENTNSYDIFIPKGSDNRIISGTSNFDDVQLPELFKSGTHSFSIPFDGVMMDWKVRSYHSVFKVSRTAWASTESDRCYSGTESLVVAPIEEDPSDAFLEESLTTEIRAFPNPVVDRLFIQFSGENDALGIVDVYDIQGKIHDVNVDWSPGGNEIEIDMSGLIKGAYMIRVNINNTDTLFRIVKLE
jgi:hypothetical protein